MKILTEADVRTGYFIRQQREFSVEAGAIVTREAKNFIEKYGLSLTEGAPPSPAVVPQAKSSKPEHMTHISGQELVLKNDDRILFRGKLDSMEAQVLKAVMQAQKYGSRVVADALLEALALLRRVMAADVKNEPLGKWTFLGLDAAQLREQSHHPEQYFGVPHQAPMPEYGFAAMELNLLRTQTRELELAFSRAFLQGDKMTRPDIAEFLNRLSSGFYILYCRALSGAFDQCDTPPIEDFSVPMEVSARHVHLSVADVERLFGPGHRLTQKRDLSQVGEFLSEERVTLSGPKGELENVAVLGPERSATQVELSMSDARALGVKAPLRLSGDLRDAADCSIAASHGAIEAKGSVIVAKNHIHLAPTDATAMGLKDQELVDVAVKTERPLVFTDVVVRVKESYRKFMHVDFDEANAAMIEGNVSGVIRKKTR